jgi:hypothetical protein
MALSRMMTMSWDDARRWYLQGYADETDWCLYQFYWRNGAPRFSEVSAAFALSDAV